MHVHISIQTIFAIHSSLPRALSQSLPTYTALFLFSSVHCFGLQLLYLFRLTGGLALPLGFRMGNGVAEKWVDNRDRQGLDHPHYPPPTKEKKKKLKWRPLTKKIGHVNFLSFFKRKSHLLFAIPCFSHSFFIFLFLSHFILLDSLPQSLLISSLSGLAERRSATD